MRLDRSTSRWAAACLQTVQYVLEMFGYGLPLDLIRLGRLAMGSIERMVNQHEAADLPAARQVLLSGHQPAAKPVKQSATAECLPPAPDPTSQPSQHPSDNGRLGHDQRHRPGQAAAQHADLRNGRIFEEHRLDLSRR